MANAAPPPAKRVYFHVGAPKTGTTYLQQVLFQNRETLAANGVLFPYERFGDSFRSMQAFRGVGWGGKPASEFKGAWTAVAKRTREWRGDTVIISNELLGGSKPERIAAGIASVQPADVHVVFSARDFARQLVSDWQEHVKHKHTVTLEKFVDDLIELGLDAPKPFGELFWGMHDAAHVLARWAEVVPVENIHVVTIPQRGAPGDTLWRRFCNVTGLDPEGYETKTKRSNASMGVAETELVRRLNFKARKIQSGDYDRLIRIVLAEHILGGQSPRLTLPPGRMEWVTKRSRQLIDDLKAAGYQVEGDLEELMPNEADHAEHVSPTELTEADLAPAAIRAASGLLRHSARQRRKIVALEAKLDPSLRGSARDRARAAWSRSRMSAGRRLRRMGLRR